MTATRLLTLMTGVAFGALIGASAASAHDPSGKGGIPPSIAKRMVAAMKGLEQIDGSEQAKGLYSQVLQWPPTYAKLRVCFMGGNPASNAKVAEIGGAWANDAGMGLKLDFGKKGKPRKCDPNGRESQIRISYNQSGYFSMIGQASVVYMKQEEASLNLEGMDTVDPSVLDKPELTGVILHEFGHALGLLHEHQSPLSNCGNEFNWDFLTKYLMGPPNNWDQETINVNLATYEGEDWKLMATDFDRDSIMLYDFPPDYYLKGKDSTCYIERSNNSISPTDRVTINYMYPLDASARVKNFEQSKAKFMTILKKAEETGATKAVTMNYEDAFFGAKGLAADDESD